MSLPGGLSVTNGETNRMAERGQAVVARGRLGSHYRALRSGECQATAVVSPTRKSAFGTTAGGVGGGERTRIRPLFRAIYCT